MNVSMKKMSAILKSLVVSYIITIAMLLVLTFLLLENGSRHPIAW